MNNLDENENSKPTDKRLDYRYGKRMDYRYGKRLDYRYGKRDGVVDLTPEELAGFIKLTNYLADLDEERRNKILVGNAKRLDYRYG